MPWTTESCEEYVLQLRHGNEYRASVKWDGCIHLTCYYNGVDPDEADADPNREDSDYIHICDIDDHIAMLQELKAEAIKLFAGRHEAWEANRERE